MQTVVGSTTIPPPVPAPPVPAIPDDEEDEAPPKFRSSGEQAETAHKPAAAQREAKNQSCVGRIAGESPAVRANAMGAALDVETELIDETLCYLATSVLHP